MQTTVCGRGGWREGGRGSGGGEERRRGFFRRLLARFSSHPVLGLHVFCVRRLRSMDHDLHDLSLSDKRLR